MYDVCLFDLDGTLTDSAPGILNSFRHALSSMKAPIPDTDVLQTFLGPPLADSFARCGIPAMDIDTAILRYREYFAEAGIWENSVYAGIPECLRRLRGAGRTLAVATSKAVLYAERIVRRFGLEGYFAGVFGSEMDGRRGRKGEVIAYALDRLRITDKPFCVMIGDRDLDVLGAKEAGVSSIGALWGYGSRAELEEAGAGRIAASPKDLADMLLPDCEIF